MWTSIKAVRLVTAGRAARLIVAAAVAMFAAMIATPGHAQPVQYVKICSIYGSGFFYIPGTDTCTNGRQIVDDQFAIARARTRASTGTSMAAALVNPFLPDGTNYAISTHWAVFDGQHALGLAGLVRLQGNLALSLGVAFGLDRGSLTSLSDRTQTEFGTSVPAQSWNEVVVLGRVGLTYSW
jgi:Porin subfamily